MLAASIERGKKSSFVSAGVRQVLVGDRAEDAFVERDRHAREVVGHHVRALADAGGGADLGVEGHAPVEGRRLDLDVGVLRVEVGDQRLHAHAVAAAEEVPPDDLLLGRGGDRRAQERGRADGGLQDVLHQRFPPSGFGCSSAAARPPRRRRARVRAGSRRRCGGPRSSRARRLAGTAAFEDDGLARGGAGVQVGDAAEILLHVHRERQAAVVGGDLEVLGAHAEGDAGAGGRALAQPRRHGRAVHALGLDGDAGLGLAGDAAGEEVHGRASR